MAGKKFFDEFLAGYFSGPQHKSTAFTMRMTRKMPKSVMSLSQKKAHVAGVIHLVLLVGAAFFRSFLMFFSLLA